MRTEDGFIKILAIDQARNGAWAIFNYETKELEKYGTFSFGSKKYTYAKAILAIETLVDELIKENDIAAVFIEDIQLRVNVQSFKKLAQLQGVLVNLLRKTNTCIALSLLHNGKIIARLVVEAQRRLKKKLRPSKLLAKKNQKYYLSSL